MSRGVHRIECAGGAGKSDRRSPVGRAKSQTGRVLVSCPRIARDSDRSPELQGMVFLGPGDVIQQIVRADLEIVAVGKSLIQSQERVPGLVGISDHSETL